MAGRRPTPTSLKIIKGNPGRRPLPKGEPSPEVEKPEPPSFLQGEALEEWHRLTDQFYKLEMMTGLDIEALAIYCQMYGRWVQAQEHIRLEGLTVNDKISPYVNLSIKLEQQMRLYLIEFGMTPSSRPKVQTVQAKKEGNDPWDMFL